MKDGSPGCSFVSSTIGRRARGLLRWYPRAWRQRYGEEFVAHLEVELAERPHAPGRFLDIVAHGVLARLTYEPVRRRVSFVVATACAVVAMSVVVVALGQYFGPLALRANVDTTSEALGLPVRTSEVADVAFTFSSRDHSTITITSVRPLGVRGFPVPAVRGVDEVGSNVAATSTPLLANAQGWPPRLSSGKVAYLDAGHLVAVLGRPITLSRTSTLWVGLRATRPSRVYALDGLSVTYRYRGISHVMVLDKEGSADALCVVPYDVRILPSACNRALDQVDAVAKASVGGLTPARAAIAVADMAADEALVEGRQPSLRRARALAREFFPAAKAGGVRSIVLIKGPYRRWEMTFARAATASLVEVCVTTGTVDESNRGLLEPQLDHCHGARASRPQGPAVWDLP